MKHSTVSITFKAKLVHTVSEFLFSLTYLVSVHLLVDVEKTSNQSYELYSHQNENVKNLWTQYNFKEFLNLIPKDKKSKRCI